LPNRLPNGTTLLNNWVKENSAVTVPCGHDSKCPMSRQFQNTFGRYQMINTNTPKLFHGGWVGFLLLLSSWCGGETLPIYVGTDTGPTKGQGIYLTQLDLATGTLSAPQLVAKTTNPTFLALHPLRKFLFAVNGIGRFKGKRDGSASSFAIDDASGSLTAINQISSGGVGPCHLSISRDGKHLLIANYTGGGFSVVPVGDDGKLAEPSSIIQDDKSNPKVQPHGHCIQPDPTGKFALGDDLGLDRIFVFRFDADKGTLTANDPPAAETTKGTGPRHSAFHPNGKWLYNIDETSSTMIAYAWDADRGVLTQMQILSTLPADFHGNSTCAEVVVHPSGRFLYGSNRGDDSIAIFKIDSTTGKLTPAGCTPTGGKTPRSFTIDPSGNWLIVGNQDSGNVTAFKIDAETGQLKPTGQTIAVPAVVCVMVAPK
jgi:6-phosphogluconolactonase